MGLDGYLTLLTVRELVAIVVDDGHLESGPDHTHGAGPVFHTGEGGRQQRGLRLAISLPDVESHVFPPGIYDLRVDGLAGANAVAQRRRPVLGQVLLHMSL